jgi:hypothetical protein
MFSGRAATRSPALGAPPIVVRARTSLAALYLASAGVHVTLAALHPAAYQGFADAALLPAVERGWHDVFMADPEACAMTLALAEALLASALLIGGWWRRAGYAGVIAFTLALTVFGWGFWLWSGPALAVIVPLAIADGLGRRR